MESKMEIHNKRHPLLNNSTHVCDKAVTTNSWSAN